MRINSETLQGLPPGSNVSNIPYINSQGNLLIAASNPSLASTYASSTFTISSAQATTIQSAGTGDIILQATESGTLKFRTGGATDANTRIFVDNAGLVGIGTTSPALKLDVAGAVRIDPSTQNETPLLQFADIFSDYVVTGLLPATSANLTSDISAGQAYVIGKRVYNTATAKTYTASKDTYVDVDYNGNIYLLGVVLDAAAPSVAANSIRLAKVVTDADNITGVTDSRALYLATTVNGSERMRIDTAGNVGIGTTNPAGKLYVKGTDAYINVLSSTVSRIQGGYESVGAPSVAGYIDFYDGSNGSLTIGQVLNNTDGALILKTRDTERMRISNAGNVGIGTTGPLAKLHVASGNIFLDHTQSIRGGTSATVYNGIELYNGSTGNMTFNTQDTNKDFVFVTPTSGCNRVNENKR